MTIENVITAWETLAPALAEAWAQFSTAALKPLRHATPQTALMLAFVILIAWLVTRFIRSATWRFSKPVATSLEVMTTYHTNAGTIALSPEEYIRAFASDPELYLVRNSTKAARMQWGAERDKREHGHYFVVTLVERTDPNTPRILGTPVLNREMRVWRKSNPPKEGLLQLDLSSLREVRDRNNSSADDVDGEPVSGLYDLYIRRVRWWDVRHWLVHPNREIRIAIWVTIISAVVPTALEALFAPASAGMP